jgi:hypothetical protein
MQTQVKNPLYGLLLFAMVFGGSASPTSPVPLMPVPRGKLCVTEGALEELKDSRMAVNVPKMRAVVAAITSQAAQARLTYLGPTKAEARLGSGASRRQFALKLRAQDGCNLVYAAWRIEPESRLVVSIKHNPGMHASSECGNHGYKNIKPVHSAALPKLKPGDSHTLFADLVGTKMRVSVDGVVVWEGDIGAEALDFDGPIGVRTDNARFEFQLLTSALGEPRECKRDSTDRE